MSTIHSKTLQDLEFPTVLTHINLRCSTEIGKERALEIIPLSNQEAIFDALGKTSEYVASFVNENRIPNHDFDGIDKELHLLKIENATLEVGSFRKIGTICKTVQLHHKFFKKFKECLMYSQSSVNLGNSWSS